MDEQEIAKRFPRTHKYAPDWVSENGFGGNSLWQTEWLAQIMDLQPGMRVLDLGCGRAKSSVFLAREFGVEVWATDLWVTATENWQRIRDLGMQDQVIPIHADARSLPFAAEFFDAITAVDCYSYYGADDLYLNYILQFVKQGGQIGIAGAGLVEEMPMPVPKHLRGFWSQDCWGLHSAAWWRKLWERTGLVEIEAADTMPDGWQLWSLWHRLNWPHNTAEIEALEVDAGRHLGYVRAVGRRREGMKLEDYAWPDPLRSWPMKYETKEMLK